LLLAAGLVRAFGGSQEIASFQPLTGTAPAARFQIPEYRLGVEPVSSPRSLWRRYQAFFREVNGEVAGFSVRLGSALTQDVFETKLRAGAFDFLIVEPHRVLEMEQKQYVVFAQAGPDDRILGVIVTRNDTNLSSVRQLREKTICFGTKHSLASTLLPRMWLREGGFRERSAKLVFTGSDETALFHVSKGLADAAAVSAVAWEHFIHGHPGASSSMKVRWRTSPLSGAAVMAHRRVPPHHRVQLEAVLTQMHLTNTGKQALATAGWRSLRSADSSAYDDVWEFLVTYARLFGYRAPGVRL
jgi:ABC-type phosphate/phosphonate transport system substrate-binding protein